MVQETWVQSQVVSYQRFLKWYLIPPCLKLSNIRYVSRVKWSNPGKGVTPSPTSQCSSSWKGSLSVALDYSHQLYFFLSLLYYGPISWHCPGNTKRRYINASIFFRLNKNPALHIVMVEVDSRKVTILVNTGCLLSIASRNVCKSWEKGPVCMTTINEETSICCRIEVITLQLKGGNPIKHNVLVAWEKPLDFDLLIGMNVTKELERVGITSSGAMEFCKRTPSVCCSHHKSTGFQCKV